jgi:hypothetical protein
MHKILVIRLYFQLDALQTVNHAVLIDPGKFLGSVMPELLSNTDQHPSPRVNGTALTCSFTTKDRTHKRNRQRYGIE